MNLAEPQPLYPLQNPPLQNMMLQMWPSPWDHYGELQTRAYKIREEEEKVIQLLKKLAVSDVGQARRIIEGARKKFFFSLKIKHFSEILSPPVVKTRAATGISRTEDFRWIKENKSKYLGQWVALYNGQCLAASPIYTVVREAAKRETKLSNVLIIYLSNVDT